MPKYQNLDRLSSYTQLREAARAEGLGALLSAARVESYDMAMGGGLRYNYAAKRLDDRIISLLQAVSDESECLDKYRELVAGTIMNTGEGRKVLHHLLRGQLGPKVEHEGRDLRGFYEAQRLAVAEFCAKVHSAQVRSSTGKAFNAVCQIGIGGSDLGPRALYLALDAWAVSQGQKRMSASFISNVDPDDANAVLASLNLETTMFVLVSKSGTTQETLANEIMVREALKARSLDPAKQMVAVTSQTSPLANNPNYLASFYIDDFIGGRYSSTSAVGGVVLSLAFGPDCFKAILDGAHAEDALAMASDIRSNPALMDALIGMYERNVLGYPATFVLPYSQALCRFPAHLQQLDMESNGKRVNRDGQAIAYQSGPIIAGEAGTNGQHSFYQLLHQGSDVIPLQFIGFREAQSPGDVSVAGSTSQTKLKANLVAQILAFACGKPDANGNKEFPGGRPSSLIYGDRLDPKALGALLAHYENKVMFQGFLWNLNSFDQEGVQLGKKLTGQLLAGTGLEGALAAFAKKLGV